MTQTLDPIAAATYPDPYPFYARLLTERSFAFDSLLGMWVAADAASATAALTAPLGRVRPPHEPVPTALLGSLAGDLFGRMARTTDGGRRAVVKQAAAQALAMIDERQVATISRRWAAVLLGPQFGRSDAKPASERAAALSAHVVGSLLGIPDAAQGQTAAWTDAFARCLAPGSGPEQIERGKTAAEGLHGALRPLVGRSPSPHGSGVLLPALAHAMRRAGIDDSEVVVANAIGVLVQAYDAIAGLIGAALLALARDPVVRRRVDASPNLLGALLAETLRFDPPVQNTRRFVAADTQVAGHDVRAGDAVLILLAAANRDPALNAAPERFDLDRRDRRMLTFGAGPHACPGAALAMTIARAGVEFGLTAGLADAAPAGSVAYRSSANARIPLLPFERRAARRLRLAGAAQ